jgi:hypothetical protein
MRVRIYYMAAARFNLNRCDRWFANDPELDKLSALAKVGAFIDVSPTFVPSTTPEKLRPLAKRLRHTCLKHAADLHEKGQVILLPLEVALQCELHFSPLHWTPKPGKPEGRLSCDLSNAESGHVLNDEDAKADIEERYGQVKLPTITDVVDKILTCAESCEGLHRVRIWKEDIVGAFNQFNFAPSAAKWLSFQVDDNIVLILFTGVFGWQGPLAVWAVFSRALLRAAVGRLKGLIVVYVDDFIGFSVESQAQQDQLSLRSKNRVSRTFVSSWV